MPSPKTANKAAIKTKVPPKKQLNLSNGPSNIASTVVFCVLLVAHVLAALYSPIQDCDETYNFWEPTHYLNHGYGLQTWEWSPEYSIRSWLYTSLHAAPIYLASLMPFIPHKIAEFYFLRCFLAVLCAACEARLFWVISHTMNPRIGMFLVMIMASSAGVFHASVAYLPSSFAMNCTTIAFAEFLDWRGEPRTARGLMCLAVGSIIGWPFAALLCVPFVAEELSLFWAGGDAVDIFRRLVDGFIRSLVVLALEIAVDSFFYRKLTCVPLNIIRYNVFSGSDRGPNIFGTDPWHFYMRNLVINFNVWFLLALFAFPLVLFQHRLRGSAASRLTLIRTVVCISPFYLWLGVFTLQPHKEERFMYPAYPCLAINAALSTHILIISLSRVGRIPGKIKLLFTSTVVVAAITAGALRSAGLSTAYAAPLAIFRSLHDPQLKPPVTTVCMGKDWYRYPSSYFLPAGARAKFVKSNFKGLLPGEFNEARPVPDAAWLPALGMNDLNKEDPGKYTDLDRCSYMVDSWYRGRRAGSLEPDHVTDGAMWDRRHCVKMLDVQQNGLVKRLFWVPDHRWWPQAWRRKWGEMCLLRKL